MESITALDGSVLDFVHIQDADTVSILSFVGTVYNQRSRIRYIKELNTNLSAVRDSNPHLWFIQKRGEKGYVGMVVFGTSEDYAVSIEVCISPKWRLNGYGRAAVVAAAELLSGLSDDHYFCVAKGLHDVFCRGLGMDDAPTCWTMRVRELL